MLMNTAVLLCSFSHMAVVKYCNEMANKALQKASWWALILNCVMVLEVLA